VSRDATRALFVDRLEGDRAVLVSEAGDELDLPLALLPEGAGEGSWLSLTLRLDPERGAATRRAVAALRRRLSEDDDGGDLVL
jgi:hypothetical protein